MPPGPAFAGAERKRLRSAAMLLLRDHCRRDLYRVDQIVDAAASTDELMLRMQRDYDIPADVVEGVFEQCAATSSGAAVAPYAVSTGGTGPVKHYDGEMKERLRVRLTAFYRQHNPNDMHKVDVAMTNELTSVMTEEQLFERLYEIYLPTTLGALSIRDYTGIERDRLRARLEDFYRQHNPAEMHKVDVALTNELTGMMTEERLFERLAQIYSPTVAVEQRAATSSGATVALYAVPTGGSGPVNHYDAEMKERLRARLTAFYRRHNPSEMHKVDVAMTEPRIAVLTEEQLFVKLAELYPPTVTTGAVLVRDYSGTERDRLRARLEDFYRQHNPHEMHKVDVAMTNEVTRMMTEEQLFERLSEIYKPTAPRASLVRDYTGVERDRLRARLEDFYRQHNPKEMHKVDVALTNELTGMMTEEQLFERLADIYPLTAMQAERACRR